MSYRNSSRLFVFFANRLAFPHPDAVFIDEKPRRAARDWRGVYFRQPTPVLGYHSGIARIARQVRPFMWIAAMIVKLFGTVSVANVSPTLAAHSVIIAVVRRDRRPGALCVGVFKQRRQAVALKPFFRRQSAQLEQRRVKVEQF